MIILAIESSCDEFSISIIKDGKVLTNIISSQILQHAQYGGVVPELAARLHLENLDQVLKDALKESKIDVNAIDLIAYTKKPGLIGSLIIGKLVAETLSMYLNIPIIGLDHIQGHIFGSLINNKFEYPIMSMVVSGGHTQIQLVKSPIDFQIIGSTIDDAIGECYDKIARVLNFPYPGGQIIDDLAKKGDENKYDLPLAKNDKTFDFSYSGLKTAAINLINKLKDEINIEDFCASFQKAATKIIEKKLELAIIKYKPKTLTTSGGVSANSSIRKIILELGKEHEIKYSFLPDLKYCTDNAAMIGNLAYQIHKYNNR